jgi:hypothetical protein
MSYIVARKVDQGEPVAVEHGFTVPEIDFEERDDNTLDNNLDDEVLQFVLGLIEQVDNLREGEALVVWKEIF